MIAGSVPCMRRRCVVIDPAVSTTPHSGHGILLLFNSVVSAGTSQVISVISMVIIAYSLWMRFKRIVVRKVYLRVFLSLECSILILKLRRIFKNFVIL